MELFLMFGIGAAALWLAKELWFLSNLEGEELTNEAHPQILEAYNWTKKFKSDLEFINWSRSLMVLCVLLDLWIFNTLVL